MKITKRKNKKKMVLFVILILVLAVLVVRVAYIYTNKIDFFNQAKDNKTNTNITASRNNANDSTGTSPKTPKSNQADNGAATDKLDATITYMRQENDLLKIGVNIGTVTSVGECTVNLSNGRTSVDYTAGIQPLASSSTCKGFEISTTGLAAGEWKISINIKSNNKGVVLEDNITIE